MLMVAVPWFEASHAMKEPAGKSALITGSTSGIGRQIALSLAARGCRIMLHGIDGDEAAESARRDMVEVGAPDVAVGDHDLLKPDAAAALIAHTKDVFGGVDILVNNAGIQHVSPIESFATEHWDRIIALNLTAPFRLIQQTLPIMRAGCWGRIINIASVHGLVASVQKSAYIAAKHGLVGLTKTVALETATDGITCNAICPGYVRTPLLEAVIENFAEANGLAKDDAVAPFLAEKQPSGDFVSPTDIGELTAFLCSDAARQITGVSVPVDGGWTAR